MNGLEVIVAEPLEGEDILAWFTEHFDGDLRSDSGRRLTKAQVKRLSTKRTFHWRTETLEARLAWVTSFELGFIEVEGALPSIEASIESLDSIEPRPLFARSYDVEYDLWQNAEDPKIMAAQGKLPEGAILIDNGLPPPLDGLKVDISGNPGRRISHEGYVEAVGHETWLWPGLFDVLGREMPETLDVPGMEIRRRRVGVSEVLHLRSTVGPFVDDTTRETQVGLRKAIFGVDTPPQ